MDLFTRSEERDGWPLKQPMSKALKALQINIMTIRGINVIHDVLV